MKIAFAADHAGFALKQHLVEKLKDGGHEIVDLGSHDGSKASDYPDHAAELATAVTSGSADRGILICGSGVGVSIAANKVRGIRAAICHDTYSARQGVEHDDMNVLVLGSRVIGTELALELVNTFLAANFTNEDRHKRRLAKVLKMDEAR